MATKISGEQFIAAVQRSGLVDEERLRQLLKNFRVQKIALSDAGALAEELVATGVLTRWQADKLLLNRSKGFFLGKYRLLLLLGRGGMSAVYLAEHTVMRRRCAIKVLPSKRVNDASSHLGRFHREAQAVACLDHPNIVRAYDVDKQIDDDVEINFLVMEYVDGPSLQALVARQGPLSFEDAADYARQSALGLAHAHQAGMVHRDIKPSNLLVTPSGVVKVLDLGLGGFFDDSGDNALTIQHEEKVLGTADYLAPEQAIDSHTVDARADIYGLGCTLFFMLTGKPPFTEGSLAQRLLAHQNKTPPPIRQFRPDVPESLVQVGLRLMAKLPQDRYQTADAAAAALRQWLIDHADENWKRAHPDVVSQGDVRPRSAPKSPITPQESAAPASAPAALDSSLEPELAAFFTALHSPPPSDAAAGEAGPQELRAASAGRPASTGTLPASAERLVTDNTDSEISQETFTIQPDAAAPSSPLSAGGPVPTEKPGSSIRRRRASRPIPLPRRGLAVAIAAIALVIVGAGLLAMAPWAGDDPPASVPDAPDVPVWLHREVTVGPGATYETITEALEDARRFFRPGHAADVLTIYIDPSVVYPERIVIDNSDSSWPEGIALVAGGDQHVALRPVGPEPVIVLRDIPRLTLRGFDLLAGDLATAIDVSGWAVGTRLEHLTVHGISGIGLRVAGAAGLPGNGNSSELQLYSLVLDGASTDAVGIAIQSQDDNQPSGIIAEACRFTGTLSAGVLVAAEAPQSVAIRASIFSNDGDGVRFEGRGPWTGFQFQNNSFFQLDRGILFDSMPDPSSGGFRFERNLFVGLGGSEVLVAKDYNKRSFLGMIDEDAARRNWSDRPVPMATVPGEVDLFTETGRRGVKDLEFHSTDPGNARFLEPLPKALSSMRAGDDTSPIGALPWPPP